MGGAPRKGGGKGKAQSGPNSKKGQKGKGKKGKGGAGDAERQAQQRELAEIKMLEDRVIIEAPKPGQLFADPASSSTTATASSSSSSASGSKFFSDLPISKKTIEALRDGNFIHMTPIQRAAIPHALCGRDIMGEAKTGSGKTLAFLVPLLEKLFREKWSPLDGLGALVISPTKELAYQIFQVLKQVGKTHDFSAGCLVGGRDFGSEQKQITRTNIIVATPGRLLQHLEETANFSTDNLQLLVLDEADRILDLGFKDSVDNILEALSGTREARQSLLFSATFRPNIHQLAAVALKPDKQLLSLSGNLGGMGDVVGGNSDDEVDEEESCGADAEGGGRKQRKKKRATTTHNRLAQSYVVTPLEEKVSTLFAFLRAHSQKKTIVFLSSCKQVRYFYEVFKRLKPGPALFEFHGKMSLRKRLLIFQEFLEKERAGCLLATDVASRGVDFPEVDWVVSVDCPESVETYIHRVGRTARFRSSGNSLLMLLPSEREGFLKRLLAKKVVDEAEGYSRTSGGEDGGGGGETAQGQEEEPRGAGRAEREGGEEDAAANRPEKKVLRQVKMKASKKIAILPQIQSILSQMPDVNHLAKKAFVSYVKSYHLQPDKTVFAGIDDLKLDEFSTSLGLGVTPELDLSKMQERDVLAKGGNEATAAKKSVKKGSKSKKGAGSAVDEAPGAEQETTTKTDDTMTFEEVTQHSRAKKLKNRDKVLQLLQSAGYEDEEGAKKEKKGKFAKRVERRQELANAVAAEEAAAAAGKKKRRRAKNGADDEEAADAPILMKRGGGSREGGDGAPSDSDADHNDSATTRNTGLRSTKLRFDDKGNVRGRKNKGTTHVYYNEEDEQQSLLQNVVEQMQVDVDSKARAQDEEPPAEREERNGNKCSDERGASGTNGRGSYLEELQKRMAQTADADKKQDQAKRRERFLKKKLIRKRAEEEGMLAAGESDSEKAGGGVTLGGGAGGNDESGEEGLQTDEAERSGSDDSTAGSYQEFVAKRRKVEKVERGGAPAKTMEELEQEAIRKLLEE